MSDSAVETLKSLVLTSGEDMVLDLEKSHRCYLRDRKTGQDYFDFFTFFASLPLGMNHPRFHEKSFLKKLTRAAIHKPANSDILTDELAVAVTEFARIAVPPHFKHLFFICGGTLAVENCLKAAFDWKIQKNLQIGIKGKGQQIIHLKQAFHGRSGYCLSITNTDPNKIRHFPKFNWPRIENPVLTFPATDAILDEVRQKEALAISQIKTALNDNKDDIAGLIIEPIQAEGGDNHFRPEFLHALRKLADEQEFLLIFDEIQTGMGLTGKWWCFEHFGVVPDLLAFGKKTQVSGVMASARLDDIPDNVFTKHGRIDSTFGGNLVDFVRLAHIVTVMHDENAVQNAAEVGDYLKSKLEALQSEFPDLIANVRGRGMMCAFDCQTPELRHQLQKAAFEQRLILLSCGTKSIRLRPMLNMTKVEVDDGIMRLAKALKSRYNP